MTPSCLKKSNIRCSATIAFLDLASWLYVRRLFAFFTGCVIPFDLMFFLVSGKTFVDSIAGVDVFISLKRISIIEKP